MTCVYISNHLVKDKIEAIYLVSDHEIVVLPFKLKM